ncbi:MAG: ribulokinase, partial [Microbacterium sp.]
MRRIALGIDYGTESVRALAVDLSSGEEIAGAVFAYPHGVITRMLPGSRIELGADWALQHPSDWIDGLQVVVHGVLREGHIDPTEVVGLGIDATACTVLPTTGDGTPLCLLPDWAAEPHAWPKLWKHHAAQRQAEHLTGVAERSGEVDLRPYGGKLSSEWLFPKALQIFEERSGVFEAAERIIEAQDWLTWQLTGSQTRSAQVAGFKAQYRSEGAGYPSVRFLELASPGFSALLPKLEAELSEPGSRVGGLLPEWAVRLGLRPDMAVAVGNQDAQVCVAGSGAVDAGDMTLVIGTSACDLVLAEHESEVDGMSGRVRDGIIPGLWAFEAGQAGVGDMLAWFVQNAVPAAYENDARRAGLDVYRHLEALASEIAPGQNSVVALDWWNGNRSILGDDRLSGALVGMTLATRPEHVYRAMLESLAFGQRV